MIKYGIGLSLLNLSKDEFILLLDDYHKHIDYIYYSSLISSDFYARILFTDDDKERFSKLNKDDQYEILNYARTKYGIKTELAVNSYNSNLNDDDFIKMIRIELKYHKPDKMVIHDRLSDKIRRITSSVCLSYSYNNNLFTYDQIDNISKDISEVVIGNRFIRDKKMYSLVSQSKRTPICLVNNACSHNCGYCGSGTCGSTFMSNLCRCGIDIPYALATLYPWEVRKIHNLFNVSLFKLSTRTLNYKEIDYLLNIMINNINEPSDSDRYKFIRVLAPMYEWIPYYNYINLNLIASIKEEIWKNGGTNEV